MAELVEIVVIRTEPHCGYVLVWSQVMDLHPCLGLWLDHGGDALIAWCHSSTVLFWIDCAVCHDPSTLHSKVRAKIIYPQTHYVTPHSTLSAIFGWQD